MKRRPARVLCSTDSRGSSWKWLAPVIPESEISFRFVDCANVWPVERLIRRPYLPRYRAALRAGLQALGQEHDVVISFGPIMTALTELTCRVGRRKIPHLAWAFNYTDLPRGIRHKVARIALKTVDCFVVASTAERRLYSDYFGLDPSRFDVQLWGINKPEVPEDEPPMIAGDYICALGGEARDYNVLLDAAELLPKVPIVVVTRKYNLPKRNAPANVTVYTELASSQCWNILKHSRCSVVPLRNSEVPCGHVTLVASMHHEKALIVSNSVGVQDYVRHEDNALLVEPGSARSMADAMERLLDEPALAQRLGQAGQRFAAENCTEASTIRYLKSYLARVGVL